MQWSVKSKKIISNEYGDTIYLWLSSNIDAACLGILYRDVGDWYSVPSHVGTMS